MLYAIAISLVVGFVIGGLTFHHNPKTVSELDAFYAKIRNRLAAK